MRPDSRSPGQVARTFTEEARRAQIIACAIDALAEYGYGATSLARIAQRAGISKGVISYHFTGKDELMEQAAVAVFTAGADFVTPRIMAETTASAMLATCLRANIEFIRDYGNHITALSEVVANLRGSDGEPRFAAGSDGDVLIQRGIIAILDKGQADGEFRDFDQQVMARAVRSVLDGVNRQRITEQGFDFDRCADELVALFERATQAGTR